MQNDARHDFGCLTRRVRLMGHFETLTALHIGRGRALDAGAASDLPVMKDALGRPFIPGSSLKGVLRSLLESLIRGLPVEKGLRSCDPIAREYDNCVDPRVYSAAIKNGETPTRIVPRDICDVCDLFGHPNFASRLRFKDLAVDEKTWHELLLQVRDGVAIDRETGTTHEGMKYDFETVPAGVRFNLDVIAENVEDHQLGLFFIAVEALKDGLAQLGGSTSRGLGGTRLDVTSVTIFDAKTLLAGTAQPDKNVTAFKAKCRQALAAKLRSEEK